jgi:3-deoxy-D-arabino-heptulosonate 7-phosphate (DAHP) synthase
MDDVKGAVMTGRLREDSIEMERRHIRMGNSWIARQEETVVQLDLMGADELALDARKPLASFYAFLAFARERLNYLERKRFGNAPESN